MSVYQMKCNECKYIGAPDMTDDVVTCPECASHDIKVMDVSGDESMTNFLIFEAATPPAPAMRHDLPGGPRQWGPSPEDPAIVPYTCIGGVRATDENAACRAVIGVTRRVGKYAVIPAVFIDFGEGLMEPNAKRPQLNP